MPHIQHYLENIAHPSITRNCTLYKLNLIILYIQLLVETKVALCHFRVTIDIFDVILSIFVFIFMSVSIMNAKDDMTVFKKTSLLVRKETSSGFTDTGSNHARSKLAACRRLLPPLNRWRIIAT